jgi:hypothetical protein
MYVIGALVLMLLWIASNDGLYAHYTPLLSIQFIYSGWILGIWISVMTYEKDTAATTGLKISILLGGLATLIANVLFGIWALDIVVTKCQNPSQYGCFYEEVCQNEKGYVITSIVVVVYLTIVDILAIIMSYLLLGKEYPSIGYQYKLSSE